jgi:hypothetical protein
MIYPNAEFIDYVVEYIAGFVSRKVIKIIHCAACTDYLFENSSYSRLLNRKNRGGLIKAAVHAVTVLRDYLGLSLLILLLQILINC